MQLQWFPDVYFCSFFCNGCRTSFSLSWAQRSWTVSGRGDYFSVIYLSPSLWVKRLGDGLFGVGWALDGQFGPTVFGRWSLDCICCLSREGLGLEFCSSKTLACLIIRGVWPCSCIISLAIGFEGWSDRALSLVLLPSKIRLFVFIDLADWFTIWSIRRAIMLSGRVLGNRLDAMPPQLLSRRWFQHPSSVAC